MHEPTVNVNVIRDYDQPFRSAARTYLSRDWNPFPIGYVSKAEVQEAGVPRNGWHPKRKKNPPVGYTGGPTKHTLRSSEAAIAEWLQHAHIPGCNIALGMEAMVAFDVDGDEGQRGLEKLCHEVGVELPPDAYYTSNRGPDAIERHIPFRIPADLSLSKVEKLIQQGYGGKLDIIHWGHRYLVAPPSIHPSGRVYRWYRDSQPVKAPAVADIHELPEPLVVKLRALREQVLSNGARHQARTGTVRQLNGHEVEMRPMPEGMVRHLWQRAVNALDQGFDTHIYNSVRNFAFEAWHYSSLHTQEDVAAACLEVARKRHPEWTEVDSITTARISTAWAEAEEQGQWVAEIVEEDFEFDVDAADEPAETVDGFSDALIAGRLATERFAGRLHYTEGLGWLQYDGSRWAEVSEKVVVEITRKWVLAEHRKAVLDYFERRDKGMEVSEKLNEDPRVKGWAYAQSAGRLSGFVRLASGHAAVFANAADFDPDPELLNTPSGVHNLRTGEVLEHDPSLLMTKITKGNVRPELADDPLLRAALSAFPEDTHEWLQVRMGEACTGIGGKELLILDGGGNNGKTGITGGVREALGGYAGIIPSTLLLGGERKGSATPEKMELRGLRFGFIEETPEESILEAAQVKALLDAHEISGRQLFQKQVAWKPSHSLVLNTNHIPRVMDTDNGVWRRLKRVRCPWRFRDVAAGEAIESEMDRPADVTIKQRLTETQHGADVVLTWAVAGARRFLNAASLAQAAPEPGSVAHEVREWRMRADDILRMKDSVIRLNPDAWVTAKEFYSVFVENLDEGASKPSAKKVYERLQSHSEFMGKVAYKQMRITSSALERRSRPSQKWLSHEELKDREWVFAGVEFIPQDHSEASDLYE